MTLARGVAAELVLLACTLAGAIAMPCAARFDHRSVYRGTAVGSLTQSSTLMAAYFMTVLTTALVRG